MTVECKIEERDVQPVASIRTRTPVTEISAVLGECYGRIMGYLGELGVYPSGAPFTAYFNMDMEDLDLEIGMPVAEPVAAKDDIASSEIPAGKYVTATHVGPYEKFEETYNVLMAYMGEQGVDGSGVAYEFYLNDPSETPPEKLITEILIQLK